MGGIFGAHLSLRASIITQLLKMVFVPRSAADVPESIFVIALKTIGSTGAKVEEVMFIAGVDPSEAWRRIGPIALHRSPLANATQEDPRE